MKIFCLGSILLIFTVVANAQVAVKDSIKMGYKLADYDTIIAAPIMLEEVVISKQKLDPEAKKQFLLLQNRVLRVYPFARIGAERLVALNKNMELMSNNRDKKKYQKIIENYMENEFAAQLKKLSRKQGQILVKLIFRQTGQTTFDLIKDYKSGWKAFWSNNTARLFDINLKTRYDPLAVNEDYLIETILNRAFTSGRLLSQPAATAIDFDQLESIWLQKAQNQ